MAVVRLLTEGRDTVRESVYTMQMKHRPVGRTGGEEDPASSGEGAQSSAGDNRSMRDGGRSDSWSISLIWFWDEGARMVEVIFTQ